MSKQTDTSSPQDWAAVAHAITQRMSMLGWSQGDLVRHPRVSHATVRQIQRHLTERRRNASTLRAISVALGWPADHLAEILHGHTPSPPPEPDEPQATESAADLPTSRFMPVCAFCTICPDVFITPYVEEAMVGLQFGTCETTQLRLDFSQVSDLQGLSHAVDEAIQLLRVRRVYHDSVNPRPPSSTNNSKPTL